MGNCMSAEHRRATADRGGHARSGSDSRALGSDSRVLDCTDVPPLAELEGFVPPLRVGKVVKVYDGDTLTVGAPLHLDGARRFYKFSVRLRGIDCPELRSRNDTEKQVAAIARDELRSLVLDKVVHLGDVGLDKYGRVLATVSLGGQDMSAHLLTKRLAVPYRGRTKTRVKNWHTFYTTGTDAGGDSP